MSTQIVNAKEKNIHKNRIEEFLSEIDKDFIPPLSSRVSIADYVQKVIDNGIILIALQDNEIVGLSGFYCNDMEEFIGYLTVIGVAQKKKGTPIGKTLLDETIKRSKKQGMRKMRLETSSCNSAALLFFHKNVFIEFEFGKAMTDGSKGIYLERDI